MKLNGNVSLVIRPVHLDLLEKLLRNAIVGIDTIRSGVSIIADSIEAYKQGIINNDDFICIEEVKHEKVMDNVFSVPVTIKPTVKK